MKLKTIDEPLETIQKIAVMVGERTISALPIKDYIIPGLWPWKV
jgi:hypothetical protein